MPKEKVYDDSGMYDIEIGWSSLGESVQLGIVTHDGLPIAEKLIEHEKSAPLPSAQPGPSPVRGSSLDMSIRSDAFKGTLADRLASFNSLWASLDRTQINRLIRMLRKARDESYGRDE